MTIFVPGWMQGGSYTAQQDRINSRAASFDEGVVDRTAFKVTQRGAGANLSVDASAGAAIVTGDDQAFQGNYDVLSDSVVNVTGFVATSANTRYDIVGIQINDPNAGGAVGNNAVLTRIAGTQAATPVIPAVPNSFLPLAIIGPFTTSTTAITNAMIHDAYTGTGPTGVTGMRLCAGFKDTPGTSRDTYNAVAPNGWLMEFGQAVSRTTFARLFEHIGTTHGPGNGSTTFNLPDSRGRAHIAPDNMGGAEAFNIDVSSAWAAIKNTLGGVGGQSHYVPILGTDTTQSPDVFSVIVPQDGNGAYFIKTIADPSYNALTDLQVGSKVSYPQAGGDGFGGGSIGDRLPPFILANRMIRT